MYHVKILILSIRHIRLLKHLLLLCFLIGTLHLSDIGAVADESDRIYGSGIHAFFDQNYKEAVKILEQAEDLKSNDPRPHYYLGLAYLRQKNTEQADHWFEKAAQLEFSGGSTRDNAVSESLRRIQGVERVRMEKIRIKEQTKALKRDRNRQKNRYGTENLARRENLRRTVSRNRPVQTQDDQNLGNQDHDSADDDTFKDVMMFEENVFGVKPMNPIVPPEEFVPSARQESIPE